MTSAHEPLGIGILGCGNVMPAYLRAAELLARRGLARVVAACGREEQRDRVTREHGVPNFVTDSRELIESPLVDVVVVITPMVDHAPLALKALEAGKHVLLEKPIATTLADAERLLERARRGPGQLYCAPFTWLSPTFREIGRRLRRGEIGRVVSARARYGWAGPDWSEWFYRPGGGAMFDLGIYSVTTLAAWLGPVERVTAMAGVAVEEREIRGRRIPVEAEDNAQILLDFGRATFAVITTGFTMQQYRGPAIELYGTEGTLQMLGDDWDPDGFELWQNERGCWQCYKETQPDWPWTDGLRELVERVSSDTAPAVGPELARHVLEVLLAAKEAGNDGQTRRISSRFAPLEFGDASAGVTPHRVHDRTRGE
jgi:predicted dehydrogenase